MLVVPQQGTDAKVIAQHQDTASICGARDLLPGGKPFCSVIMRTATGNTSRLGIGFVFLRGLFVEDQGQDAQ